MKWVFWRDFSRVGGHALQQVRCRRTCLVVIGKDRMEQLGNKPLKERRWNQVFVLLSVFLCSHIIAVEPLRSAEWCWALLRRETCLETDNSLKACVVCPLLGTSSLKQRARSCFSTGAGMLKKRWTQLQLCVGLVDNPLLLLPWCLWALIGLLGRSICSNFF